MVALKGWKPFKKAGFQEALDHEPAQVHRSVGAGILPGLSQGLRIIETAFRDCSELRWAQPHFVKDTWHNHMTHSNRLYLNLGAVENQERFPFTIFPGSYFSVNLTICQSFGGAVVA